ncbi:MAG: hypothetical protein HY898_09805 [Deltaproteobacteria bacterium]|nr:hypothetical protein [Deltaproteobacteria bacterium]
MTSRTVILALVSCLFAACSGSTETTGGGGAASGGAAGTGGVANGGGAGTGGAANGGTGGTANGGNGGTGGAVTGGSAGTGGMVTGGSSGMGGTVTGGSAGAGAAGGPQAAPECKEAAQCTLWSDCCNCLPLAPGEQPPPCNQPECFVSACTSAGISATACAAGQCVFDVDCDESSVLCNGIPPTCAPGEVPSVKDKCWTGKCVQASMCTKVTSCAKCQPPSTCVVDVTQMGPQTHCVQVPDVCKGQTTCACLGNAVCQPPYDTCSDSNPPGQTISCSCPAC